MKTYDEAKDETGNINEEIDELNYWFCCRYVWKVCMNCAKKYKKRIHGEKCVKIAEISC